jgi:hypothetical protein
MRRLLTLQLLAAALLLAVCAPAGADVFKTISLVSDEDVLSAGGLCAACEQAVYAHDPALSGNGRYVAFDGYFDGLTGVWRRDLQTGEISPVAVGEAETQAGSAELPSISENGQYVSFTTTAALTPQNDQNIGPDVYVRDMSVAESQPCTEEEALHPIQPCAFTLVSAASGATRGLTYEYAAEGDESLYGALAAGRSALSANGQKIVFVTSAVSNLDGERTPPLEVAVRDLETSQTELVSVEYDPETGKPTSEGGRPKPVPAIEETANRVFGAVYSTGVPPSFEPPHPYRPTPQVPASINAEGNTVVWLGQDVGAQTRTLPSETLRPEYSEPLWRRIAAGPEAPTRQVTGGSDPANPACTASGEEVLPLTPSASDPCQGPFATTNQYGIWTGGEGDTVPRLSADGYTVAFIANAPLVSLGNDFGAEKATRHGDLYVANMHEGLTRAQALTPLTELASGNETDVATNAPIEDFGISPDGLQIAFTTRRIAFPLGSPAYVSAPATVPGMLELFDVDLTDETLTRVSNGYGGEASEHPHEVNDEEDQYLNPGDGALSPSFSDSGEQLAFSSTASNLVYGDGNTPPLKSTGSDGGDVFLVEREVFSINPTPQSISPVPPGPLVEPAWRLGVTAVSLPNGTVRLYAELPGAGTLSALARAMVTVRSAVSSHPKRKEHDKAASVRAHETVVTRQIAAGSYPALASGGGLGSLMLTLSPAYRSLAARAGGLSATVGVTFTAAGHPTLRQSIAVAFLEKASKKATKKKSRTLKRTTRKKAGKESTRGRGDEHR